MINNYMIRDTIGRFQKWPDKATHSQNAVLVDVVMI
jgi:hypothetical protein